MKILSLKKQFANSVAKSSHTKQQDAHHVFARIFAGINTIGHSIRKSVLV